MSLKNLFHWHKRTHLQKLLALKKELYGDSELRRAYTCPACRAEALKVQIEAYAESATTLFFECRSCGFVDHISLREPPPPCIKKARGPGIGD